jgi:hypothetical protein
MQHYYDLQIILLKFVTALRFSTYAIIIRRVEIRVNCCTFHVAEIGVFIFTLFLHEVNAVPLLMSHVLSFFGIHVVYKVSRVDAVTNLLYLRSITNMKTSTG